MKLSLTDRLSKNKVDPALKIKHSIFKTWGLASKHCVIQRNLIGFISSINLTHDCIFTWSDLIVLNIVQRDKLHEVWLGALSW